jgi:hypothetical protein
MSMDLSFLYDFHCLKVFSFAGDIREPRIPAGDLNATVPQELLKTFQAHPRIEHLGGKGMPETMKAISLVTETRLAKIPGKHATSCCVRHRLLAWGIENELFVHIPFSKPGDQGFPSIIA